MRGFSRDAARKQRFEFRCYQPPNHTTVVHRTKKVFVQVKVVRRAQERSTLRHGDTRIRR